MARVVFLHKLPTSFVVVGRGFSGNGRGERRLIPYQLFSDRAGDRPLHAGLFENETAAESYCAKKGWSMQTIDLDGSVEIHEVPGGKVKAKSDVKWGWACSECDCHNTKRPGFRHLDSYKKRGTFDPKAIKASLPENSTGYICTSCHHRDASHFYAAK